MGRITLNRWQTSVRDIQSYAEKNTKKSSEINSNVCFLEEVKEGLQMFDRISRFHGFISTLAHWSCMVICLIWDSVEGGYTMVSLPADWFAEISAHYFSVLHLFIRWCWRIVNHIDLSLIQTCKWAWIYWSDRKFGPLKPQLLKLFHTELE